MALPLPAYGAGVPDSCQQTPSRSRSAALRVPGPVPTSRPSRKSSARRLENASGFHPPLSPIGLRGEATYGELGNEFGGNSTRLVTLTANAIFGVSSPTSVVGINPYVIVGGGWYSYDPRRAVTLLESQKQNKLGLNGGVGLRVGLAGFSTYAEARYHYIFVDDVGNSRPNISFIPLTFGITF